ncbi:unnamed protein product [Rhizoctonia solani]|nr:unnamed protein product [Rhizoctonia solani]
MDLHPTDLRPAKRRQSAIIKYGGFLGRIIPRISRRPLGAVGIISSRPRHASNQSISSLAAAATLINIGFAQTPGMSFLSETTSFPLKNVLATQKIKLPVSGTLSNQRRNPLDQPSIPAPSLDEVLNRSMSHHDSSDLAPTMSVSVLPPTSFDAEEQGHTTSHLPVTAPLALDVKPLSISLGRATSILPRSDADALVMPFNEANIDIHPTPIPPYIRSIMRASTRTSSIYNSTAHNNYRLLSGSSNQSSSSLLTTATYVTAPTSPPPSVRSLPRCESPTPLSISHRRIRVQSFQTSSLRHSVIPDDYHYEDPWAPDRFFNQNPAFEKPRSPTADASSIYDSPSRKILIVGSSYKDHSQVKKMFSIETLDGALEDRNRLKTFFKERSYSVQTLFEEGFNRERALARIAQFLADAESGDVRAVVFTGHGYTDSNGTVSLVPPECSEKSEVITRAEWDQNIRNNSRPGVIVFSIMAHCFSGEVMRQCLDSHIWDAPAEASASKDEPIFLTFAASDETAYESWVTRDSSLQSRSCDHFIHALIGAIQSIDVNTGTWNEFFEAFDWHFQRARSCASWQDKQCTPITPNWRSSNLQTPRFSASGLIRLSVLF